MSTKIAVTFELGKTYKNTRPDSKGEKFQINGISHYVDTANSYYNKQPVYICTLINHQEHDIFDCFRESNVGDTVIIPQWYIHNYFIAA
jgi:hypothetical protein